MLGIDCGASAVKFVLLREGEVAAVWQDKHQGRLADCLIRGLQALSPKLPERFALGITGCCGGLLHTVLDTAAFVADIPAITEGVKRISPGAGSAIEIGSQGSRFITGLQGVPQFAANEHCAGGTGSFFEDQMSRLGLSMEDFSSVVEQAVQIPRLSGRCAVFAKTDIIHRQQEGATTPDILLGLCYAMIRNYKAAIVGALPLQKPVVFCGGVTQNTGVVRAIREVFDLTEAELLLPELACFTAAVGAAAQASGYFAPAQLMDAAAALPREQFRSLSPLRLPEGIQLTDPVATGVIPPEGCALGIDIGSTSTDLVLLSRDGALIDHQYLRTSGDPEKAVRLGLDRIRQRFGEVSFLAVGVTGSGRERIGRMLGADAIRDEITAQARGAIHWDGEVDTVFEIGGQDSKYISLRGGEVADFQMNKICAAGTGSFLEEQAARMGVPIGAFGPLALTSGAPADLGERCTVFIETAITSAAASGVPHQDIAAGLCHSVIRNYLHKVVGTKPVGNRIMLQGGVCYNPGIVSAFYAVYGDRLRVNPCFSISGAFGAASLALECVGDRPSSFVGFEFAGQDIRLDHTSQQVRENIRFYRQADRLLLEDYTGRRAPRKKTVGVPFVLMIHKFFPMANAFFTSLGFNVLLTRPTDEETIRLAQEQARGETCYPVKLIYGHMKQLMAEQVDYIFLPAIHTMKHASSHVEHNYGCVYMQTAAASIAQALDLEGHGIKLLSPVFDLDFGQEAMASAMLGLGKRLGRPKPLCIKALLSGAMAVRRHTAAVEKQGRQLLDSLKPDEKVLVLITRNYGVSDPVLNMGVPKLLLERGHKIITLSHLPAHDLDIHGEYPNLYWPFGQHILSGAKIIANHPNLYAVYLTNHGCGPDSMLSHLFQEAMGDKPYLQIEVDEHFSKVGVVTRIEAFLNSLSHRPAVPLPSDFDMRAVPDQHVRFLEAPSPNVPLFLPQLGCYTPYLIRYCQARKLDARALPPADDRVIGLGRACTSNKEYLPFVALLGAVLAQQEEPAPAQFLIPQTLGAEADGQYARVICGILARRGRSAAVLTPTLERLPEQLRDPDLFFRGLAAGDLLYAAPVRMRSQFTPEHILSWMELETIAAEIGSLPCSGKRIAAVGTPMCLTTLGEEILDTLDQEGNTVLRAPLTEQLWFLWKENHCNSPILSDMAARMKALGTALGRRNPYSSDLDELTRLADQALPNFSGGNGRYRFAKGLQMGRSSDAVLTLAPRYENTAMVMEMRGLTAQCPAPLYSILLDHDWDESAWSKLRSFLFYCGVK